MNKILWSGDIGNYTHFTRLITVDWIAMFLALLLLELVLLRGAVGDQFEISLNGDSWSLSDTDGRVKAIKAQVPGSVHLDLMYADSPTFCYNIVLP